jgi:toxin-antitoxin system PIN domain toxin
VNLIDVNVLIHARRKDAARHAEYRAWLADSLSAAEPVAVAPHSVASAIRVLSHRGIWRDPLSLAECLEYAEIIRAAPATVFLEPGPQHWDIFAVVCRTAKTHGNVVMDAWLAALAIEHGCTIVTTDRDFARFKDLKWRHPLRS